MGTRIYSNNTVIDHTRQEDLSVILMTDACNASILSCNANAFMPSDAYNRYHVGRMWLAVYQSLRQDLMHHGVTVCATLHDNKSGAITCPSADAPTIDAILRRYENNNPVKRSA